MANKPNIRFKGFTDDWEQRKLGELVSFSKGSGYSKGDLKENGTPIILYGRLYTKYETVISEVDTFVDAKENSVYSKGGEVIVPGSGETAEDISIASVVKKSGVLLGGDLNIITPPKDMDAAFLAISISNGKSHNDMAKMAQGKSVVHLHNSDLAKIDFPYPSYEEQCKISRSFSKIDRLITLHQRKCDETKKLKKFMLQKMFPKNGEKIPEIRFAGFTNDWEQRKVAEITKFHKQGFYTTEDYSEKKKYYLLRGTNLTENKLILKDTPKIDATEKDYQAFKTEVGDFLIVRSGTVGTYGIVYEDIPAIFGSYLIDFRFDMEQVTNEFFGYFYQSESFKSQLRQIVQQSANTNINAENIKSTSIMLPIIDEQKKIGDYLAQLDHLITLHQRKCDQLKQIKKYMLQNMFPQKG